jgi:serine/threonine-protein kinase
MTLRAKTKGPPLPSGTVLDGRFELRERLGGGAFGDVYRAVQSVFGRPVREVALKLFSSDAVTPENVGGVLNDAIALMALQEENPDPAVARHLVQVLDMGLVAAPEQRAYMSMRLVPGKMTLDTEVRRFAKAGGMPVALSLRFLRQIPAPLAWMHTLDSPLAHGDLKPDNVLLDQTGTLILTDFGLATRMPLTSLGGAVEYQAPEQLAGASAGVASDIYAIGLLWHEMLTGRHPFEGAGLEARARGDDAGYVFAHQEARRRRRTNSTSWSRT